MIIHGDCIEKMAKMEPCSIDAIVTDPPYGLEFMGKEWDRFQKVGHWDGNRGKDEAKDAYGRIQGRCPAAMVTDMSYQRWTFEWATEALNVLKPGGSMLAFGGTRTFHRLACGLEDAGFAIKDCLMWLYGSGFPKAQDLGKLIDKREGVERDVVGERATSFLIRKREDGSMASGDMLMGERNAGTIQDSLPATPLAKHWDGFKIGGIKPAWEPILWLVKPPDGTWTDNVLEWGVGAVNVDESRIKHEEPEKKTTRKLDTRNSWNPDTCGLRSNPTDIASADSKGRFPANLLLSHHPDCGGECHPDCPVRLIGDESRFFYSSKATDRDPYNDHPTLKPTGLIEWLIRLITRPGQTVLDPFAGSGTTAVAAIRAGRDYILIERDEHYCEIAERRVVDGVQVGMF